MKEDNFLSGIQHLKEILEKDKNDADLIIQQIFKLGSVWEFYYGENNINNKKVTILSVVENHIVFKWYGKHKKRWFYCVDHVYLFIFAGENGNLKEGR